MKSAQGRQSVAVNAWYASGFPEFCMSALAMPHRSMNASGVSASGVAELDGGDGSALDEADGDGETLGSGTSSLQPTSEAATSTTAAAAPNRLILSTTHLPEIEASRAA